MRGPKSEADLAARVAQLERELAEALAREAATAEVLGVIGKSRADPQPVFQAILERATQLCDAHFGALYLLDDEQLRAIAVHGAPEEFAELLLRTPLSRDMTRLRRMGPWRPLQVPDFREHPAYQNGTPAIRRWVDEQGARTWLAVPLVNGDRYVGAISIWREEVRPFEQCQVDLVSTFAARRSSGHERTPLRGASGEQSTSLAGTRSADGRERRAAGDRLVAHGPSGGSADDRAGDVAALRR